MNITSTILKKTILAFLAIASISLGPNLFAETCITASSDIQYNSVRKFYYGGKLIDRIEKIGKESGKRPKNYNLNSKVKIDYYRDFFERALKVLEEKKALLEKELKLADKSLYRKSHIDSFAMPAVMNSKKEISALLNYKEKTIVLQNMIDIGIRFSEVLNFRPTDEFLGKYKDFLQKRILKVVGGMNPVSGGIIVTNNKSTRSYLAEFENSSNQLKTLKSHLYGHQLTTQGNHYLHGLLSPLERRLTTAVAFGFNSGEILGYNLPLFSWEVPSQYTQLKALQNNIHIISFVDKIPHYDLLAYGSPSQYTAHDFGHRSFLAGTFSSFRHYKSSLKSFGQFLTYTEKHLRENSYSDEKIYSVIQVLSSLTHENRTLPPNSTYSDFSNPLMQFSRYYGEIKNQEEAKRIVSIGIETLDSIGAEYERLPFLKKHFITNK